MLLKVWKRKSVFWDLKYWEKLSTPHCLDMMHITKNVCESLLGTLFDMPEKSKDGLRARQDLKSSVLRVKFNSHPRLATRAKPTSLIIALQLASLSTRPSLLKFSNASMVSKLLQVTQG